MKRRIRFVVPVDIEAVDEKALAEAISRYRIEPCHSILGLDWSFEQRRPYLLKKREVSKPTQDDDIGRGMDPRYQGD